MECFSFVQIFSIKKLLRHEKYNYLILFIIIIKLVL